MTHSRRARIRGLSFAISLALALGIQPVRAQGGAGVYAVQFRDLKAQLTKLAARADDLVDHGTPQQKLAFGQDTLALAKLIHKLGEDAAASNLRGMQHGRDNDKTLLLVATGTEALSLEVAALDAFVDTGDRIFKTGARDAESIASNLEKAM